MNTQLPLLTKANVSALYSLSDFMQSRGLWASERDIRQDMAESLYGLFQLFAWSDGALHKNEYRLLDAALEVDAQYGGHMKLLLESGPLEEGKMPRIPGCLTLAAAHDAVHGTKFVDLVLHHLKNIALLVMMSDSKIDCEEEGTFVRYFRQLDESVSLAEVAASL